MVSQCNVADYAYSTTGYFHQSHMTRAFKAMRDLTPGEYRRNHRTQTEA